MKKIFFLIFLFLSACAVNNNNVMNNNIDFSKKMNFEEFGIKLKVYSDNTPYPNIDDQMKKNINIALIGLGQVGIYLYNELNTKKKEIETKTGKKN